MNMKNKLKKGYCIFSLILATFAICVSVWYVSGSTVYASSYGATDNAPNSSDWVTGKGGVSLTLDSDSGSLSANVRILLVITILALAPSILIMLTSFTRIIIVLHFVRSAIGTQTSPPNQILIGLALFLTFFIMWPTFTQINENAITPLDNGEITQEEALDRAVEPIRNFMYGQTQEKDLKLFCEISDTTI